ncbi:MAG: dihydrofolate reductase [Akkermansia sp.]|nr:dihydrofolate reductase [Akkermansia sp.]
MSPSFTGVVAMDAARGLGLNNGIPWRLKEDMQLFKRITMGHPILMGRKTWESLGRPLPGRQNIVLTRNATYVAEGAVVITDLAQLENIELQNPEIMVIGGAQLYARMLPQMQRLHVSEVQGTHEVDTWFPEFAQYFAFRTPQQEYDGFTHVLYEK